MRNSCKAGGTAKKKYNAGGGATPDPNIYKLNKTGVFGKYKSKDISKEKFDRINNRLSRDTDNTKYGTSSSPREGISKEGIGQREISVDRANRDIIKAKQEKAAKTALEAAKERARAALKKQYEDNLRVSNKKQYEDNLRRQHEDNLRESKRKIMKRSGGSTKKKYEAGGGIIPSKPVMTAPMQGRLGNRPVAGGNMAKGGSTSTMEKKRKVSSISKEFDGKEVQGKLIERSGLFGSKVKKEVFKFPGGGKHVEKTRTNKKGDIISKSSKDTKVNPFRKGGAKKK
jgi:hypothetical protein